MIDGVLLSPLPYPASDRIVQLGTLFRDTGGPFGDDLGPLSPVDVFELQRTSGTLEAVAASRLVRRVLPGEGGPRRSRVQGSVPALRAARMDPVAQLRRD